MAEKILLLIEGEKTEKFFRELQQELSRKRCRDCFSALQYLFPLPINEKL